MIRSSLSRSSLSERPEGQGVGPREVVRAMQRARGGVGGIHGFKAGPWESFAGPGVQREENWMTLSGLEAVESCNSWQRICDLMDPRGGRNRSKGGNSMDGLNEGNVVRLVVSVEVRGYWLLLS